MILHRRFLAICFDEEQAQLQGLPVKALYLLLLVLTAVTTVLLIQVVGIILVITMLAIPAAIANISHYGTFADDACSRVVERAFFLFRYRNAYHLTGLQGYDRASCRNYLFISQ